MRKKIPIIIIGWTVTIVCALLVNVHIVNKNSETLERVKLNTLFELMITTRLWNSNHSRVYVPVTDRMQPNPYLISSRRDAVTNYGDSLTMVNPALMTRQISELSKETVFHITALNPIRPGNKPDEWEIKALRSFKKAGDEYFEKIGSGDSAVFRYMAPLVTTSSCLSCHASQGYKLGDIRGGISINTRPSANNVYLKGYPERIIVIYVIIYLIGFFTILYFKSVLVRNHMSMAAKDKEFKEMCEAKDKFFGIIAHDMKTPAANIKSLSEMLRDNYFDLTPNEQRDYIEMLSESAGVQNNMLNNLLDLFKLRTGKIPYVPQRLDIRKLIDDVLEQTKLQAMQKQITLANQAEECYAKGDSNMVETVIRNLVANAVKFTHTGGQIIIRATYDAEEVLISVTDTGIGIPGDTAKKIFDPDRKKSTLGTNKEPGSGMGLALCKELVEYNSGKIGLESKPGFGTTFFFTLPADI